MENKLKDPDDLFDLPQKLSCSIICCKMEKALIGNVDQFIDTSNNRNRSDHIIISSNCIKNIYDCFH